MAPPPVIVFSITGCRHCRAAKSLLKAKGVAYNDVNLDDNPARRAEVVQLSGGRKTVPQIFFGGKHIGGNEELQQLESEAKLDGMLAALKEEADDVSKRPMTTQEFKESHGGSDAEEAPAGRLPTNTDVVEDGEAAAREKERLRVEAIVKLLRKGISIKDRRHHLVKYRLCFIGSEAVDFLEKDYGMSRAEAVATMVLLNKKQIVSHVSKDRGFEDGQYYYRFAEDEATSVLNIARKFEGTARSASALAEDIRRQILALYASYLADDGSYVDYAGIAESTEFENYVHTTSELQAVDLGALTHNEKLAFFINIYNALVIHGNVTLGKPTSMWSRLQFFKSVAYQMGGHKFTLNDIEQGILRRNRRGPGSLWKPFSSSDPRRAFMLDRVDPRIHFALVCGAKSCPPIKLYRPEDVQDTLTLATEAFLDGDENFKLDEKSCTVTASKIFSWYKVDFGGSNLALACWAMLYLPTPKQAILARMLGRKPSAITSAAATATASAAAATATAGAGAGGGAGAGSGAVYAVTATMCEPGRGLGKGLKVQFAPYDWGSNSGPKKKRGGAKK